MADPETVDRITLILRGVAEGATEAERQHGYYLGSPDPLWLANALNAAEGVLDGARDAVRLLRDEAKAQAALRRAQKKAARSA